MIAKTLLPFLVALAISLPTHARAAEGAQPPDAEAKARLEYEAALKVSAAADAALGPLRTAMQAADTAYANAKKAADAKRQQATDAKNLAGEQGVKDLKQAEENVPIAAKALTEAIAAKPPLDQAVVEAKAVALPLQQAYEAAEKLAKEAAVAAKAAADAANKLDEEAKRATNQATAMRRAADSAKTGLARAQQNQQQATAQAAAAAQKLPELEAQKKAADAALAVATAQFDAAAKVYQPLDRAAAAAEANAKPVSEAEKQAAAADAAAKRKAADAAKAALTQAQQAEQQAQARATAAAQKVAGAPAQKKAADEALAKAKGQVGAAAAAIQAAEKAAQTAAAAAKAIGADPAKAAEEKKRANDDAAAKRMAVDAAKAALAKAQQEEKQAQAQVASAVKSVADAPAQKKAADDALAKVKGQVGVAAGAQREAEQAAQAAEAIAKAMAERAGRNEEQKRQAAADAVAKRKAADAAKPAFEQAQDLQRKAQDAANSAGQKLGRVVGQKQMAESTLVNLKAQIEKMTASLQSAEQAAQAAAKVAEEKSGVAAQAAAKAKPVIDAANALTQAQQAEQAAQAQIAPAAQKLAEAQAQKKAADAALAGVKAKTAAAAAAVAAAEQAAQAADAKAKQLAADAAKSAQEKKQAADDAAAKRKAVDAAKAALAQAQKNEQQPQGQANAAAQKVAEADGKKKAAEAAAVAARNQATAAIAAGQAAVQAGGEPARLAMASRLAAADAAAKRKAADAAKATLAPVQKKLDQALVAANSAAQKLTQAEARKKSVEEALENLKKRIASSKQTHVEDEKAAVAAEAVAAPLKAEADRTRAAYSAALDVADDRRADVEKTKAALYRLIASRQVASLMETAEPVKPSNRIDEILLAKLKTLGIQPTLCPDGVFLRRAYLDLTGKLPSADDARAFIQSSDKNKRAALIDRLLDQTAHADYWAMKWSDVLRVKAEFPVKVWPNAAQAYYRWLWESVAQNRRYDQFARELLTSSGSNYRVGPVNFYRAIQDRTPEGIAGVVALAFMGTRIHTWPEERRAGMASFFTQVGYKPTSEWKEEIVFWDPLKSIEVPGSTAPGIDAVNKSVTATNQIPQALAAPLNPNGPVTAMFPDGKKIVIPPDRDPREAFAEWLIRPENPWFAKAIANRTWAWAMGRGIIHEPDNIRDDNPPGNPELLAYLEKEVLSSGYDLRHLKRLIFTSTAYQFSSIPRWKTPEAKANFASYQLRRMDAEVLIDVLNGITGSSDLYTSAVPEPFTYIPNDMSAVALADGSISSSFLTLFGRSARATGMEDERVNELASPQWLHMLNSVTIQGKLQSGPKISALISAGGSPKEIAERLYLTILSRLPTEADVKAAEEHAKSGVTKGRDIWIDIAWALINSPEFLLKH